MTIIPITIFDKRETDSDGCVKCPSTSSNKCPTCKTGEQCEQVYQTCRQCAQMKCRSISSGSSKSTPVGGIIGGAIGGFTVILLVAGVLYYKYVYRKKHPLSLEEEDDDDILMSDIESETDRKSNYTISNIDTYQGDPNAAPLPLNWRNSSMQEKPASRGSNSTNKRISSYESFTRPQVRNNRKARRVVRGTGARKMRTQAGSYLETNSSRNSVATSMSTTNASNILPIAYIPGVTVRPTKNNTRSIYSYETDSIFSDMNTIENASIIGDVMRTNQMHNQHNNANANADQGQGLADGHQEGAHGGAFNKDSTMTAIKAQPKLVNVDRIEEEDEDITDDEEDTYARDDLVVYNPAASDTTTSVKMDTTYARSDNELANITGTTADDSDSDVDSDIGEITRATSVKRPHASRAPSYPQGREVLLDVAQDPFSTHEIAHLGRPNAPETDTHSNASAGSAGSFVLDVEIDDSSPFHDQ